MHDPTKMLLGASQTSEKEVSIFNSDPATYLAGLAVRIASTINTLGLAFAAGRWAGISLGRSLADSKKTAVCRAGLGIPLRVTDISAYASLVVGDLTFTAAEKGADGNSITIALVDGETAGEETVTVDGTDIVVGMDDGVSTAQQIADAINASAEALALLGVEIAEGEEATAQDAAAEAPLEDGEDVAPYLAIGDKVYLDDVTGMANASDETVHLSDAVCISGVLDGIAEDGSTVPVVLVDMPGGL